MSVTQMNILGIGFAMISDWSAVPGTKHVVEEERRTQRSEGDWENKKEFRSFSSRKSANSVGISSP